MDWIAHLIGAGFVFAILWLVFRLLRPVARWRQKAAQARQERRAARRVAEFRAQEQRAEAALRGRL